MKKFVALLMCLLLALGCVSALAEGEKPVAVYAYCNLHGLWKAEI